MGDGVNIAARLEGRTVRYRSSDVIAYEEANLVLQCAGRLHRFQIVDTASRVTFRLESGLDRPPAT